MMINSLQDVKNFLNDSNFKKIFLLCGKKSFITSGAEKFVKNEAKHKEIKFHYKSSEIPTLIELRAEGISTFQRSCLSLQPHIRPASTIEGLILFKPRYEV